MVKVAPTNAVLKLSGAGTNELRDIRPPVNIPSGWAWLAWVGVGIVVAALAFALWKYIQARRRRVVPVPVIPPHVLARQRLQQALALLAQPREFCIAVSGAERWYLEQRFNFRAPERTTEEFLYELQATNLLTPAQKTSLGGFLQQCDLVKFAKYQPGEPELRQLHGAALKLIEETEPVAAPPAPAAVALGEQP